jgi:multidrug resistance efflux pump
MARPTLPPPSDKPLLPDYGHLESSGFSEDYKIEHDRFLTLATIQTSSRTRLLAVLILAFIGLLVLMAFLPWQQNIQATGSLTAFHPSERPQEVPAIISGRVEMWYVREGQFVRKGDPIIKLTEIKDKYLDPETPLRVGDQLTAKGQSVEATQDKLLALDRQIVALQEGLQLTIQKWENKIIQAQLKLAIDSADLEAVKVSYFVADTQYVRFQKLYQQGLISLTALEARQTKFQDQLAKLQAAHNKVAVARNELLNARVELNASRAEYQDKLAKAQGDRSATLAYLQDGQAGVAKLQNDFANISLRQNFYVLRAPQDGFIVKAKKAGLGEIIKEGDAIVTIMPDSVQMAVELYVRAADVPLLHPGRVVRLEFDGWPALQFSGWPSVAVGTFGGKIAVVDYVNSPGGTYRVLVTPDPRDEPWPAELRIGSGVYGWAMLDEVPLWYEVWRQFNAFPPSLKTKPEDFEIHPEKYKLKGSDYDSDSDGK